MRNENLLGTSRILDKFFGSKIKGKTSSKIKIKNSIYTKPKKYLGILMLNNNKNIDIINIIMRLFITLNLKNKILVEKRNKGMKIKIGLFAPKQKN